MRKIRLTKKDGNVKVEDVNRNILGILNSYILKTGKPVAFHKALPYALFSVHLSISNLNEWRRDTSKSKLNDILLQDLENHTYEVSSRIWNCCRHDCINKYHPKQIFNILWIRRIICKWYSKRLRKSWHNSWLLQDDVN